MNNKIKVKRIIFVVLIVLNCSTIFYFSNQVADDSSAESSRFVEFISEIIPSIKNMQEPAKTNLKANILTPIVRKSAHLSIYTLLGIFTYGFVNTFEIDNKKKILYAIAFCICYSISDEIHQMFVDGRSCELRDVIIDTSGAFIGIILANGLTRLINKRKKETI